MAYYTGSVNNLTDLRQALVDACVLHGWSWSSASDELTKGVLIAHLTYDAVRLNITGRITVGSGVGAAPGMNIGRPGTNSAMDFVFPAVYRIFVFENPDEVYLSVNYNLTVFQWLAFGQSTLPLPGTGMWVGASNLPTNSVGSNVEISPNGANASATNGFRAPALFYATNDHYGNCASGYVHSDLDGNGWSPNTSVNGAGGHIGAGAFGVLNTIQPNAWNSEAVLIPLRAYKTRPSSMVSLVADLVNARHLRIDNYEPGQIITLGADQWMVFPWMRKNSAVRNGGQSTDANLHTGTIGWAIRYESS